MLFDTPLQRYATAILTGLNAQKKHVYGGTVDPVDIEDRRRKNRAARKARRITRGKR